MWLLEARQGRKEARQKKEMKNRVELHKQAHVNQRLWNQLITAIKSGVLAPGLLQIHHLSEQCSRAGPQGKTLFHCAFPSIADGIYT